ncbi:MAG TPA: deaminase [Candidatus Acidoferrales bacterium]|nr:deaminase [Candidatus Acidoferrales bacterium]
MDDHLRRRIREYVDNAYLAALQKSRVETAHQIAGAKASLAQRGLVLSGAAVHEIARVQGDQVNKLVQARADALLDAHELYAGEIGNEILAEVKSLHAKLVAHITEKDSGLPPGVPAAGMFKSLLEDNTGAIVSTIACQIEQRKVAPKFKRADIEREFEKMAIEEARLSLAEDQRRHPKVGAVVVKDGKVVSKAHRGENPKCHAEFIALEAKLPDDLIAGSTVYTTLEPCTTRNHPKIPCAQRLIERRVDRVVIGMLDPNPEIRGMGIQALNDAGIETQFFPRDLQSQIEEINRDFIRAQRGRQLHPNDSPPKATQSQEENPKAVEILKHKGKDVVVFNRQKYGNGYLEGYWATGAVVVDCTPLYVVLQDRGSQSKQTFALTNVEVGFDFEKDRLKLTLYR